MSAEVSVQVTVGVCGIGGKAMKFVGLSSATILAASLLASQHAEANVITLTFAGLNGNGAEAVENYYNGGTGSLGSGPGPNYGISFTPNGIVCNPTPYGTCNTAGLPAGSQALYFLSGSAATMDVPAGFTTGFSFEYTAPFTTGTFVNVWSGLDDSGTLLATIVLPETPPSSGPGCFGQPFCPYEVAGITFAGVAMSADFGGATDAVAFSDITLGSATPGIPEPAAWTLMLMGFGGLGAAMRARRRTTAAA
jgi:hypothetical protein